MSKVYVGEAIKDEKNNARGGEPGDQTGSEVCIREWRLNPKGWRVLRAKDPLVAEKIAWDAKAAAANPHIGYDQGDRRTLYDVAKLCGFNCADVSTACECDCSSLVQVCVNYGGIKVGRFNTASEAKVLLKTGAFEELTGAEYTESPDRLRRGDILVTVTKGHTCICVSDGDKSDELIEIPEKVVVVGKSVRVRAGDSVLYKTLCIAHKGDSFPLLGNGESGWYMIDFNGTTAYITNKSKYTKLV